MEEALRLVDDQGVTALTMRSLAGRLDVEAMTLYAHIPNKDALLDAIADRVASELKPSLDRSRGWQDRIRDAVDAWADMRRAHPRAFPLIYRARAGTDAEHALTEELMDALATAGFDAAGVALAYQTLVSFLDGALLQWPWATGSILAWEEIAATVDRTRYPRIADTAQHAGRLRWEEVFATGLELLLHGLEHHAEHQSPSDTPSVWSG